MFWHRLALALGRTVAELQSSMSSPEFNQWMAYYKLSPFGEDRADLRAGIIASTTANMHKKKGTKPFAPRDFMLDFMGRKKELSDEELKDKFKAATVALGGKVK